MILTSKSIFFGVDRIFLRFVGRGFYGLGLEVLAFCPEELRQPACGLRHRPRRSRRATAGRRTRRAAGGVFDRAHDIQPGALSVEERRDGHLVGTVHRAGRGSAAPQTFVGDSECGILLSVDLGEREEWGAPRN